MCPTARFHHYPAFKNATFRAQRTEHIDHKAKSDRFLRAHRTDRRVNRHPQLLDRPGKDVTDNSGVVRKSLFEFDCSQQILNDALAKNSDMV